MLNEAKIKEKIATIINDSRSSTTDWIVKHGNHSIDDEIYRLFLPALEALDKSTKFILGGYLGGYEAYLKANETITKLNGD